MASLLRRIGSQHLELIEDSVQSAIIEALSHWVRQGRPSDPTAWLYQVAYRKLMNEFRNTRTQQKLRTLHLPSEAETESARIEIPLQDDMSDALLRTLFLACHVRIPIESQLVFTLKSLCGFDIDEISQRLFISKANVYKRFSRARTILEKEQLNTTALSDHDISDRMPAVHKVLYLLFTEGYLSSHSEYSIRRELCEEAIRLTLLLADHSLGKTPQTDALLALMYLHLARLSAREDQWGALLLLEQQDRTRWDQNLIRIGLRYLEQSAQGDQISHYHVEAGIAAEHCLAKTYDATRWERIVSSYSLLKTMGSSPMTQLNAAIAMAEWKGAQAGLDVLNTVHASGWFETSYHWYAVKADLLYRTEQHALATQAHHKALQLVPTEQLYDLLIRRFDRYSKRPS